MLACASELQQVRADAMCVVLLGLLFISDLEITPSQQIMLHNQLLLHCNNKTNTVCKGGARKWCKYLLCLSAQVSV